VLGPSALALGPAAPNPFTTASRIPFALPHAGRSSSRSTTSPVDG
jgi:hypothetical protein